MTTSSQWQDLIHPRWKLDVWLSRHRFLCTAGLPLGQGEWVKLKVFGVFAWYSFLNLHDLICRDKKSRDDMTFIIFRYEWNPAKLKDHTSRGDFQRIGADALEFQLKIEHWLIHSWYLYWYHVTWCANHFLSHLSYCNIQVASIAGIGDWHCGDAHRLSFSPCRPMVKGTGRSDPFTMLSN